MRFYKNIGIPVVAYAEALYGIEFSSNVVATHAELHKHIGEMSIVPITENTVRSYLEARQAVPREKKRLNDTWIAANALEHDATILTGELTLKNLPAAESTSTEFRLTRNSN